MVYSKTLNLEKILNELPKSSGFLVAFSGGSDSTALLHLFSHVKNTRAIHINHGINENADSWENHCQKTCDNLQISLIIEKHKLPNSSENTCRKARNQSFKKHLKPNEILLTAHHADDQAETIILKLLRGTGLNGIGGMEKIIPFHHGHIARVLLKHSAQELKMYLKNHNLNWIEDDSNQDNNYRRNFIRNKIMPLLENHWPNANENITRSGKNIQNSKKLLDFYTNFKTNQISIAQLSSVPRALQCTLFYQWLSSKNLPVVDKSALEVVCRNFIDSASDKNPSYKNKYYQLIRWKGAIYCLKNYEIIEPQLSFNWDTKSKFIFPNNCGYLNYHGKDHLQLIIKFNQVGQKLKLIGHSHTKTVKNLFQENNIPTWNKHNTPFIYSNGQLISLGDKWSSTGNIGLDFEVKFKDLFIGK